MANIFQHPCFCLITGASRGLGREIALQFAQSWKDSGVHTDLVLLAKSKEGLEETKALVEKITSQVTVHIFAIDLGNLEKLQELCPEIMKLGGTNQRFILVHNAGTIDSFQSTLAQQTDGLTTQKFFDINYTSMTVLTAFFLSSFPKEQCLIVQMTSLLGRIYIARFPLYSPSRAARSAYMGVLIAENPEVRVLNYSPGPCDTDMSDKIPEEIKKGFMPILKPEESIRKLVHILQKNEFKNGCTIDYYDK